MDSELTTVLVQICNELKGIRVALECLALLEAYDSNIASKSDQQRNRAKKNSGSISCASDLRKAKACGGRKEEFRMQSMLFDEDQRMKTNKV